MHRVSASKDSIATESSSRRPRSFGSVTRLRDLFNRMSADIQDASESAKAGAGKLGVGGMKNDWLTNFCRTIGFLTSLCALLCLMAFATALFHDSTEGSARAPGGARPAAQGRAPPELARKAVVPWEAKAGLMAEHTLRVAGVICSIIVILAETEWERFLQYFAFLDFWISRGLFQVCVAALTQSMAHAEGNSDLARSVTLYRNIASTSLCCCGVFYVFSGMVCIGALRRSRRRRELERLRMMRDLEDVERQLGDVERRRLELQSLLGSESSSRTD